MQTYMNECTHSGQLKCFLGFFCYDASSFSSAYKSMKENKFKVKLFAEIWTDCQAV